MRAAFRGKSPLLASILTASLLSTSCGSLVRLMPRNDFPDHRFLATRSDFGMLKRYFVPVGGSWSPLNGMWIATPFTLADIPLALALDIALLPYDQFRYVRRERTRRYWEELLASEGDPTPVDTAMEHYDTDASVFFKEWLTRWPKPDGEKVDYISQILTTRMRAGHKDPRSLGASHLYLQLNDVAAIPTLLPSTWVRLYRYAATNGDPKADWLWDPLAGSPAIPVEYIDTLWIRAQDPIAPVDVRHRLICNKAVPDSEIGRLVRIYGEDASSGDLGGNHAMDSSLRTYLRRCRPAR